MNDMAFGLLPSLHRFLRVRQPQCLWMGADQPEIALTFDDGPHPGYTPPLLRLLERYDLPATFFLIGQEVQRYPALVQEIYQRGHWLGLHGWGHWPFLGEVGFLDDLDRARMVVAEAAHIDPQKLVDVRPPYGLATPGSLRLLNAKGYRPVMWHVVPEDWSQDAQLFARRLLAQTRNGSVIVLHDGVSFGRTAAAVVEIVVPQLRERGYRFVTVERLWQRLAEAGAAH
jgi:peptidoglycan/xylan/chitin deacetylase (PgdA/CDA1 family)